MTDAILSFLALASLVAFLAVIGSFIREADLIVILIIGVLLAAYDFWRAFRVSQNDN
jgi:hypothetical protein